MKAAASPISGKSYCCVTLFFEAKNEMLIKDLNKVLVGSFTFSSSLPLQNRIPDFLVSTVSSSATELPIQSFSPTTALQFMILSAASECLLSCRFSSLSGSNR